MFFSFHFISIAKYIDSMCMKNVCVLYCIYQLDWLLWGIFFLLIFWWGRSIFFLCFYFCLEYMVHGYKKNKRRKKTWISDMKTNLCDTDKECLSLSSRYYIWVFLFCLVFSLTSDSVYSDNRKTYIQIHTHSTYI